MPRRSPTAEETMNSVLWGCLAFAAIVTIIVGTGGVLIIRSLLH